MNLERLQAHKRVKHKRKFNLKKHKPIAQTNTLFHPHSYTQTRVYKVLHVHTNIYAHVHVYTKYTHTHTHTHTLKSKVRKETKNQKFLYGICTCLFVYLCVCLRVYQCVSVFNACVSLCVFM